MYALQAHAHLRTHKQTADPNAHADDVADEHFILCKANIPHIPSFCHRDESHEVPERSEKCQEDSATARPSGNGGITGRHGAKVTWQAHEGTGISIISFCFDA